MGFRCQAPNGFSCFTPAAIHTFDFVSDMAVVIFITMPPKNRKPHMKLHPQNNGKANRRISNIEPQNVEGWFRFAQSFSPNLSDFQVPTHNPGWRKASPYETLMNLLGRVGFIPTRRKQANVPTFLQESLNLGFYKIDTIPSFDIRYSVFVIRYSLLKSFLFRSNCPLL